MKAQEKTVKEMIQELRIKGYRIEEIAREIEVCLQTIYRWEWEQCTPNVKNMRDLVNFWKLVTEGGEK